MKILEGFRLKNLDLKNRLVFPAIGTNLCNRDSSLNEKILGHYGDIARGGPGLIITEICKVDDETGRTLPNQLSASSIGDIEKLRPLADLVHSYNSKILLQLQHPGMEASPLLLGGRQPLAPSDLTNSEGVQARAMTKREIQVLINKFCLAGKIAQEAGFDGVEIHAAHGYLLSQFLSPDTNRREDEFGGNIFKRVKIIGDIVEGIREFCRPDFLISVRINGSDFLDDGLTIQDSIMASRVLESLGVDLINVSSGTQRTKKSVTTIIEPRGYEEGWKKDLALAIREALTIPVIACNNIKTGQLAEDMVQEGVCDLVAVGRGQLADNDFVNKIIQGRMEDIVPCISCLACINSIASGGEIVCSVNKKYKNKA